MNKPFQYNDFRNKKMEPEQLQPGNHPNSSQKKEPHFI